jgi:hypothetical protein
MAREAPVAVLGHHPGLFLRGVTACALERVTVRTNDGVRPGLETRATGKECAAHWTVRGISFTRP